MSQRKASEIDPAQIARFVALEGNHCPLETSPPGRIFEIDGFLKPRPGAANLQVVAKR